MTSWMLGSQWSARPTRIIARHETASGSQGLAANQSSGVPGKPVETPARDPCRGSAHRLSSGQRGRRAGQAANALDAGGAAECRLVEAAAMSAHSGACPTQTPAGKNTAPSSYSAGQASSQYWQCLVTQSPSLCRAECVAMHSLPKPSTSCCLFPEIASAASTDEHEGSKTPTRKNPAAHPFLSADSGRLEQQLVMMPAPICQIRDLS